MEGHSARECSKRRQLHRGESGWSGECTSGSYDKRRGTVHVTVESDQKDYRVRGARRGDEFGEMDLPSWIMVNIENIFEIQHKCCGKDSSAKHPKYSNTQSIIRHNCFYLGGKAENCEVTVSVECSLIQQKKV